MKYETIEICEDVMTERNKSGRNPREILEAMRDEGYIRATDTEIDECVAWIQDMDSRKVY